MVLLPHRFHTHIHNIYSQCPIASHKPWEKLTLKSHSIIDLVIHYVIYKSIEIQDGSNGEAEVDSELEDEEPTQEELLNTAVFVTTDNASNISKAVEDSPFQHIRCFAHTINLSVKNGLEVAGVKSMVSDIRQIVKHFRKSYKSKYALEVSLCSSIQCSFQC